MSMISRPRRKLKSMALPEPKYFNGEPVPTDPADAIRFFNRYFPVGGVGGTYVSHNLDAIQANMQEVFGRIFTNDQILQALGMFVSKRK